MGWPACTSVQVAVISATGGQPKFLTNEPGDNWQPAWSPDGTRIAYVSDITGTNEVWVMSSDGILNGNLPTQLTFSSTKTNLMPRWSQDGRYIIWLTVAPDYTVNLNMMDPNDRSSQQSYGPALPHAGTNYTDPTLSTSRCRRFDSL